MTGENGKRDDHRQAAALIPKDRGEAAIMTETYKANPEPGQCRAQVHDLLPEPGAIREWHRQLREGLRTKTDIDALSRAACAEFNAREWTFHPPTCNEYRRQAAAIMRTVRPELTPAKPNVVTRTPAIPFSKLRPTKVRWSIPG